MKRYLPAIWYSMPVQLLFLHFRKYQLMLLFWFFLGSTISGGFMNHFGSASLFLAPEYQGNINFVSGFFVGAAYGIFVMSWHITTFILYSSFFKFLATTTRPFLKYCLNNSVIPALFLINYFIQLVRFDKFKELMDIWQILLIAWGFLGGLFVILLCSFFYFYGSEKAIIKTLQPVLNNPQQFLLKFKPDVAVDNKNSFVRIDSYLTSLTSVRKARSVSHYSETFLDTIFKRHHFAAVAAILIAFVFLIVYGLFLDYRLLQLPASASIFVFFSVLIAASGALVFWLRSWSIPLVIILGVILNVLFQYEIVDIRNKAFGLNYEDKSNRPAYSLESILSVCAPEKIRKDSLNMIAVLEQWKRNQKEDKPLMMILNFSGGGTRSATFSVNMLSQLDSAMGGTLMQKTFCFSGASGGMLGAAYYREMYRKKQVDEQIDLQSKFISENISKDLLNPIFSAYVTRDMLSPVQKFSVGPYRYVKDRGYAFEQQLLHNTGGVLNDNLKAYQQWEHQARIPLGIFTSTISQDGRKLMICTQPISFLMRPIYDSASGITAEPDAIDYGAYFKDLNPYNLRILTALRMNATFPYVLPNVWLPTKPIVDVMDAGLRDNYGQEITLRFLHFFSDWIQKNTSGVLFVQIRDRKKGEWNEDLTEPNLGDVLYKPFTTLQYNFYKIQDYMQGSMMSYSRNELPLHHFVFTYRTSVYKKGGAALSFHLTQREKMDIAAAVYNKDNREQLGRVLNLLASRQKASGHD
jgi:hypothetical protein